MPPPTPNPPKPLPLYRALRSIAGESWSSLQIKAITVWLWRRKSGGRSVLASQAPYLSQLSRVYEHTFLISPPTPPLNPTPLLLLPSHSSLS